MATPNNVNWFVAAGIGLGVLMLLGVFLPRLMDSEGLTWVLALGGGVVAAGLYLGLRAAKPAGESVTKRPEQ